MKVLQINSVCGIRSTGRICTDLLEQYEEQGHICKVAYGRESVPDKYKNNAIRIGSEVGVKVNGIKARIFDNEGFNAPKSTEAFLEWADEYNPDLLWLHNLHGYYINVEMLFEWIKSRPQMEVNWLLHDCWAFTGHCAYFTMAKCNQWKSHCSKCNQIKKYPKSLYKDNCFVNYERKKEVFCGVKNMKIITPSRWLANLVEESFLKEYQTEIRNNTIDLEIFKPTPSDFRERHGIENKKIILGVASVWDERKGLDDFVHLSKKLDESYIIVLVGLTEKQKKILPQNIIGISKTNSTRELAEIYTASDVLFNPTYEDNYPTINLEAQACGTPVITYETGGSPESVPENNVIEVGNIEKALAVINDIISNIISNINE